MQENFNRAVGHSVATANGDEYAAEKRDTIAKRLPPVALAESQELAGQYFEKYQPKH
ncbi:hypothetical protein [Aeromonas salmonicida]|uniref:hypothetical protein n=1 Tax=Aeromonas salmonicida TaxID=645 RepID=UPI0013154446|nr:hypothetical protein [Aeromonas salmonicida]